MTLQKIVNRLNDLERRLAELESREAAPAYSSLQRDGKVGMSGDQLTPANLARINYNGHYNISITEDFTSLPTGWSWAGSPFVTPATVQIRYNTWLYLSGTSGAQRSFFYRTSFPSQTKYAMLPALVTSTNGMYTGIRFDDGTDNNYVELVLMYSTSGNPFRVYYISRVGGGTVTETEITNLAHPVLDGWLLGEITGTFWSNWYVYGFLRSRSGSVARCNAPSPNMTFNPARVGIVVKFGSYTWHNVGIDAVNF